MQSISFHLKGHLGFSSLFVASVSAAPDSFRDSLAGGGDGKTGLLGGGAKYMWTITLCFQFSFHRIIRSSGAFPTKLHVPSVLLYFWSLHF